MQCPVCNSPFRHQIEVDLLSGETIESIMVKKYGSFSSADLQTHAVAHMQNQIGSEDHSSIASKLACREADMLTKTYSEYMATLQRLGNVISSNLCEVEDGNMTLAQAVPKSTVDLYLGAGNQIRETVKLLTETYSDMNADSGERENKSGISKLVTAINNSRAAG